MAEIKLVDQDEIGGSQMEDLGERTTLLFLHNLLFYKLLGNGCAEVAE